MSSFLMNKLDKNIKELLLDYRVFTFGKHASIDQMEYSKGLEQINNILLKES